MKVLQLPLLRIFLAQVVMTLILTISLNDAHAQRRGGGHHQGGNQSRNVLTLNQYMYDGQKINLSNQMLLQGVTAIQVKASASAWNSSIILKVNGQKLDEIQLSQYSSNKTVPIPTPNRFDRVILRIKGNAYIESVKAIKHNGPANSQEKLVAQLYGQRTGSTLLKVKKLVKEQNGPKLQGKNVKKVLLVASSRRGRAQATLLIDGRAVGYSQTIPRGKTKLVFKLQGNRNIVGKQIRNIEIQINGQNITLNKVVVVTKDSQAGHHNQNQTITFRTNRSVYGSQLLTLTSLIDMRRVNSHLPVKSLVIDVEGHGNVMINGGGIRLGSIQSLGQFGTSEKVMVNGVAQLNDIKMRVSGKINIKSIKINLGY